MLISMFSASRSSLPRRHFPTRKLNGAAPKQPPNRATHVSKWSRQTTTTIAPAGNHRESHPRTTCQGRSKIRPSESQHFQKFISLIPNNLISRPLTSPGASKVSYNCKTLSRKTPGAGLLTPATLHSPAGTPSNPLTRGAWGAAIRAPRTPAPRGADPIPRGTRSRLAPRNQKK